MCCAPKESPFLTSYALSRYNSFLEDLDDPTTIFAEGATLDLAMEDCFVRTRNWLMDVMDMAEEETIALMSMGVDFGVTQVVDANWYVNFGRKAAVPLLLVGGRLRTLDLRTLSFSFHSTGAFTRILPNGCLVRTLQPSTRAMRHRVAKSDAC